MVTIADLEIIEEIYLTFKKPYPENTGQLVLYFTTQMRLTMKILWNSDSTVA